MSNAAERGENCINLSRALHNKRAGSEDPAEFETFSNGCRASGKWIGLHTGAIAGAVRCYIQVDIKTRSSISLSRSRRA